ncbi:hypothetical protein MLD38_025096 [Melastoma candidum]|uniref:Uncharacterized protein n=1 Tax=Melastoma candidum TaxID=119954 RepID=A0ACB9NV96_9MYRT|nr:hypothetical protein MLD38_025096 [Melastoma candidum]
MATAAVVATCSTIGVRCFLSNGPRLAASGRTVGSFSAVSSKKEPPSSPKKGIHKGKIISQKKYPGLSKEERPYPFVDGDRTRGDDGSSDSRSFGSFGMQKKEKRALLYDLKEQQVETGNFQAAAFLNAVVKVYCTHTAPDYSLPWQKQRQFTSTGSAFMIGDGKLLTNAHYVEHYTQVKVKRRGDDTKYVTKDAVTVVGYPLGGDTISVTKGVVSRIEVTSYAHGSSDLLGIQIDAAINPGNSGGPAFNDQGECIGVAFQVYRSEEAENIGYVIPTTVISNFLNDYERNGKYTGFPCLGVLLQKLENPALRACLKVESNEGVLVRKVEPTSDANKVLKEGDVRVSFDDTHAGCEGTVSFRSTERIAFRYLISQKFAGDFVQLGIIIAGQFMKVPYHIEGGQPSYLIIAGLLKLLAKARHSLARFKGEQIAILSQVLANDANIGYEVMRNQQVLKFNGTRIKNIHHLAHLIDSCKDKYLVFEFDDNYVAVLEREAATATSSCILKDYGIPCKRSPDLLEQYVDSIADNEAVEQDFGDSPVSSLDIENEGILGA